jgi:hypothetical protein
VSIGVLHRPGCSGEEADGRVTGTWAQASPGASEAIHTWWENRQELLQHMACRQKQEGQTEQQIFAFQVIEQKAEGQGSRIRLFLRILILPKLTTTLEYSRREITLVPIEFHRPVIGQAPFTETESAGKRVGGVKGPNAGAWNNKKPDG